MPNEQRSLILTDEQWQALERLAAHTGSLARAGSRTGEPSWRTLIAKLADGELELRRPPMKQNRWIGTEGTAFERVQLAFEAFGYRRTEPDIPGGEGAYVMNITRQYQAELSQDEVATIIEYGLTYSRQQIRDRGRQSLERMLED